MPDTVASPSPAPASWVHRALRLVGDVSADEVRDVLLMFVSVLLLLVAYYMLKTVREPLILATGGAELKTYAAGAQAAVLLFYVPLYGALAAALPVQRLVTRVNLAMVAVIQLFVVTGMAGLPFVGFAFYVFIGIFSLTLIAQFWSFANDIYRKEEGTRLFPVIAVGATAGAPLGAALASELFHRGVSPWAMMEIATGLLLVHTWLYRLVHRDQRGRGEAVEEGRRERVRAGAQEPVSAAHRPAAGASSTSSTPPASTSWPTWSPSRPMRWRRPIRPSARARSSARSTVAISSG